MKNKKQVKAKSRELRLKKERNIKHNNISSIRYRLDMCTNGEWHNKIRVWPLKSQAEEFIRCANIVADEGGELLEYRIKDLETGKTLYSSKADNPKGSAPDKIADGVKAAEI